MAVATPLNTGAQVRKRRRQTQLDRWLVDYEEHWTRYVRRFDRRLASDDPVRTDIRFWEARACRIDVGEFPAFFWFFGLNPLNRLELYRLAKALRAGHVVERNNRRAPLPGDAAAGGGFAKPAA